MKDTGFLFRIIFRYREICKFFHANRACSVVIQFLPTLTHPTDLSSGVANHQGVVMDIFGHDGTCTDECVTADGMAADDSAVGAKGGAALDEGGTDLVHFADFCSWVVDVREDHRRPAEDAVFEGDAFIDADVILDFAFVPDYGVGADDDVLADVAVVADF